MTLGGKFAGFTECRKKFLDFKRLPAGIFPVQRVGFICFLFGPFYSSTYTSPLMHGGAILDNKYNSSTLVGLRHLVIAWHALLSPESSL